jgi:hypothetical protein
MDDNTELCNSDPDEVIFIDEMTGGQGGKESAAMQKKLPILKQSDQNRKTTYPFLEIPTNGRYYVYHFDGNKTVHYSEREGCCGIVAGSC